MFNYKGNDYHHVAVFGIGDYFRRKNEYIKSYVNIEKYIDNDISKCGKEPLKNGIECILPEQIINYNLDFIIIGVEKARAQEELVAQLLEMDIPFCTIDEVIDLFIDDYEEKKRKKSERDVKEFFEGKKGSHRLILINTPQISSTIGDHAISTAEVLFIKNNFVDRIFIEIGDVFFWENREEIRRYIFPSDTILIQGGGYMGSLWRFRREDTIRYILQSYKKNKVVVLPMTMFFDSTDDGKLQFQISKYIYNSHEKLTVCFREKNSYKLAKAIFEEKVKTFLIPDTVTSLNYTVEQSQKKRGIAVFFKNDKETILSLYEQQKLKKWIKGRKYEVLSMSMFYPESVESPEQRQKIIYEKLDELSKYEMVITDAMHGMVLAAVSGTACIGVESLTGKVGGIYEWLKPLPYIAYAATYDEICVAMDRLKEMKFNQYENKHLNHYFEKLKEIIR
ncbi:MAG: hypothetical protein HFG82_08025 [Dorea sp.]|jgi:exopolysaccharide biosynthesis predicted pyruvyltransferase EpsI|nr:hypothetical protein [Dorea sp.]